MRRQPGATAAQQRRSWNPTVSATTTFTQQHIRQHSFIHHTPRPAALCTCHEVNLTSKRAVRLPLLSPPKPSNEALRSITKACHLKRPHRGGEGTRASAHRCLQLQEQPPQPPYPTIARFPWPLDISLAADRSIQSVASFRLPTYWPTLDTAFKGRVRDNLT